MQDGLNAIVAKVVIAVAVADIPPNELQILPIFSGRIFIREQSQVNWMAYKESA